MWMQEERQTVIYMLSNCMRQHNDIARDSLLFSFTSNHAHNGVNNVRLQKQKL